MTILEYYKKCQKTPKYMIYILFVELHKLLADCEINPREMYIGLEIPILERILLLLRCIKYLNLSPDLKEVNGHKILNIIKKNIKYIQLE